MIAYLDQVKRVATESLDTPCSVGLLCEFGSRAFKMNQPSSASTDRGDSPLASFAFEPFEGYTQGSRCLPNGDEC